MHILIIIKLNKNTNKMKYKHKQTFLENQPLIKKRTLAAAIAAVGIIAGGILSSTPDQDSIGERGKEIRVQEFYQDSLKTDVRYEVK